MTLNIFSHSAEQTFQTGYAFGQTTEWPRTFLLYGPLGVGKTVFCKGLVCGLGLEDPDEVTSPSFTLINEYPGRLPVFHVDLYRVEPGPDLETLGLEEILDQDAVILVEWPEKLSERDRQGATQVRVIDMGGESRRIEVEEPLAAGPSPLARGRGESGIEAMQFRGGKWTVL